MDLNRQLVKLGDMIGDGLADEPGGAWIRAEYRRVLKALGIEQPTPRKNRSAKINEAVGTYVGQHESTCCGSELKQSRSGSFVVQCLSCKKRYRLREQKKPR